MAFTYTETLATDRDKIRFAIGDTIVNDGPRPRATANSNFSDAEIAGAVTMEGGWTTAAAFLCEVLAREWAAEAGRTELADYKEDFSNRAQLFADRALELRARYGGWRQTTQSAPTRVDGFSDSIDSEET